MSNEMFLIMKIMNFQPFWCLVNKISLPLTLSRRSKPWKSTLQSMCCQPRRTSWIRWVGCTRSRLHSYWKPRCSYIGHRWRGSRKVWIEIGCKYWPVRTNLPRQVTIHGIFVYLKISKSQENSSKFTITRNISYTEH